MGAGLVRASADSLCTAEWIEVMVMAAVVCCAVCCRQLADSGRHLGAVSGCACEPQICRTQNAALQVRRLVDLMSRATAQITVGICKSCKARRAPCFKRQHAWTAYGAFDFDVAAVGAQAGLFAVNQWPWHVLADHKCTHYAHVCLVAGI